MFTSRRHRLMSAAVSSGDKVSWQLRPMAMTRRASGNGNNRRLRSATSNNTQACPIPTRSGHDKAHHAFNLHFTFDVLPFAPRGSLGDL